MFIMSDNLYFFRGYSLVDITATGVTRCSDPDSLERNQQRNWETVLQCISLRTQPLNIKEPVSFLHEVGSEFGDFYQGTHKIWTWSWAVEREGIYAMSGSSLGGLQRDFEQVPVVVGLEETARFMLPIFYPYGTIKNIYFKQIQP